MSAPLAGATLLVRFGLRRDRVRLPMWAGLITALTAASAGAVQGLYSTPEDLAGYAETVSSSGATRLINGYPGSLDTIGSVTAYEVTSVAGVLVALMACFTVVRHTRAEEESGRAELMRAGVIGRHAATLAALLLALGASLLVGVLDAVVLIGFDLPVSGSVLHGAALAGVGWVFAGVAATAAQLVASARAALGLAGAAVGAAFVVRGLGAVAENGLRWLSPFGWQEGVRAYGEERAWPLLLLAGAGAVAAGLTAYLLGRRDAGAGLRHPRPGPARAAAGLATPSGLAWRLQRGLVLGWAAGLAAIAAIFGSVGQEVTDMVADNPDLAEVFATTGADSVLESFFAFVVAFLAVVAAVFSVSSVLRLRADEEAGHAEVLLATRLRRTRWAAGGLLVTAVASLALLVVVGLAVGGTHALVSGDGSAVASLTVASLASAPATALVIGVVVLLWGWSSRAALLGWAFVGFAILENYLGDLLELPDAVSALSPYWWLPAMPVEDFEVLPAVVLLVLAAAAVAGGLVGLRRRDLG